MIRILINGETIDLPRNFSLAIEDTNPIFNELGSQSFPATVTATPSNCRLLGFPDRLDSAISPNSPRRKAVIADGAFIRSGILNVTGASRAAGINFNVGFDNSALYSSWQGTKLAELPDLPVIRPQPQPGGYEIDWMFDELRQCSELHDPTKFEMVVFPLAVAHEESDDKTLNDYWEVLNLCDEAGRLIQPSKVKRNINGTLTEVEIPEGYFVTPFLRVWRVLELIFEALDVRILSNPFKEDPDLVRLVMLNNTADAACTGKINYAELMPDCTVGEFLNALWARFGLVCNVNFNAGTVTLELIRDILSRPPAMELNPMEPRITYNTPQYLKLSAATSCEGAEPPQERFEDFVRGISLAHIHMGSHVSQWQMTGNDNPYWDGDVNDEWYEDNRDPFEPEDPDPDYPDYPDPDYPDYDYDYYSRSRASSSRPNCMLGREFVTGRWYRLDNLNGAVKEAGSSFFSWDPQPAGCEPLEISSVDECVPVVRVSNVGTGTGHSFNDYCPLYLFGSRHFHSYIKGSQEQDEEADTPLAFAWAYPLNGKFCGRIIPEGDDGKPLRLDDRSVPSLSLLWQFSGGHYDKFWRLYDEILRQGNRSVEFDVSIRQAQLQGIDLLSPLMLRGVRCLVDKLSYSLPGAKEMNVTFTLRTIAGAPEGEGSGVVVPDVSLKSEG